MVDKQEDNGRNRTVLIVVTVLAVILAGAAIGYFFFGGSNEPEIVTTTTSTTLPTTTSTTSPATTTTTSPPETTIAVPQTPAPTIPPDTSVDGQITFTATEDTYIDTTEERPLGFESFLLVENDAPDQQETLLRFVVEGLPDDVEIASATLRLFINDASDELVSVNRVEGDWDEQGTTAADAPTVGDAVASFEPGTELTFVEMDITELVDGNGVFDIYLVALTPRTAEFASRESLNPPTLVLRWD